MLCNDISSTKLRMRSDSSPHDQECLFRISGKCGLFWFVLSALSAFHSVNVNLNLPPFARRKAV